MRRKNGSGLTSHEREVLAAVLRLHREGVGRLYGYELFASMTEWGGRSPMNHGTLYRCLRSIESRRLLSNTVEATPPRPKVYYELTPDGIVAAREAVIQLLASERPPNWVDVGLATHLRPEGV